MTEAEKYSLNIVALEPPTWDIFNPVGETLTSNSMFFDGLQEMKFWQNNDKATLPPQVYTFVNRSYQKDAYFTDLVTDCGGSAANTWTTVLRGLQNADYNPQLTLICTVSNKPSGMRIKAKFEQYGNVEIYPTLPATEQELVISPTSFIYIMDGTKILDGEETPAKKGTKFVAKGESFGNKQLITVEHIDGAFAEKKYDIAFCSGAAVDKYKPEVAERFIEKAREQGSDIIFSLPTELNPANRKFSEDVVKNHATIILANSEELRNFYSLNPDNPADTKIALEKLRDTLAARQPVIPGKIPTAFISDGMNGAFVVIPDHEIIHVPIWHEKADVKDTTGAGDNFNAGVIIGILLGFDHPKSLAVSAIIGQAMSYGVIQQIGAQLHEGSQSPVEIVEKALAYCRAEVIKEHMPQSWPPKLIRTNSAQEHAASVSP